MPPTTIFEAFARQLQEAKKLRLQPYKVTTGDDLLFQPPAWQRALVIDLHLEVFLQQHPHMKNTKNLSRVRRAIEADLQERGII